MAGEIVSFSFKSFFHCAPPFSRLEEPKDDVDDSADNFKNHYIPEKLDVEKLRRQNQELIDYFHDAVGNPKYVKMMQGRKKLPAWNAGPSILETMRNRQVSC